jgi:hypothetical protein
MVDFPEELMLKIFEFLGIDSNFKTNLGHKKNAAAEPISQGLMKFVRKPSKLKFPFRLFVPRSARDKTRDYLTRINLRQISVRSKLPEDASENLRAAYLAEIADLEKLINRDLSSWRGFTDDLRNRDA